MAQQTRRKQSSIIKRRAGTRELAVFIDGTALDRAARRLKRKIDMSSLLRGVTSGIEPKIARYYTIIPYEDDSRHRAFLDAVRSVGLDVIVKRLPPKGVTRQVSVDLEMAVDMIAYGLGHRIFKTQFTQKLHNSEVGGVETSHLNGSYGIQNGASAEPRHLSADEANDTSDGDSHVQKVVTVVCPSRELAYPMELLKEHNVDTVSVDFGKFNTGDVLKSAAKWIDLSDSETIWRD
jgi:NYN domain